MNNNLTKIFSKIIQIILTIIISIIITILMIPSKAIATPRVIIDPNKTERYLFLGNSKTYYNNFPFMFQEYANKSGKSVVVREATRGGHSLKDLWDKEYIRNELNNENNKYDYLVMQPRLLDSESGEKDAAINIVNALKSKNPNIIVIINGIWKSGDEYKTNTNAQNLMNKRFRELKEEIINKCGVEVKISYWGEAVLSAHYTYSKGKNELFTDDRHPTALSSYLGVATLYSTIYGTESNCEYNGKIDNEQFKSIGGYDINNWTYQIDKDRWPKDTVGINNTQLMQNIAYKTYVAQKNSESEKIETGFKIDNSPRINIKNSEGNKGVTIKIKDYSGLKPENIKIYEENEKTEINSKYYKIESENKNNTTYKIIYKLNSKYFNKKDKIIYIVAKDDNGNYNKSHFLIKWKKNNKYSVDAAPRIKELTLKSNEKQISFNIVDKKGIKYLKIYDLNQKDNNGETLLVKQIKNIEGSSEGKGIAINLQELKERDNGENENAKDHYYNIKVVAEDVNGRKCKRIINYLAYEK